MLATYYSIRSMWNYSIHIQVRRIFSKLFINNCQHFGFTHQFIFLIHKNFLSLFFILCFINALSNQYFDRLLPALIYFHLSATTHKPHYECTTSLSTIFCLTIWIKISILHIKHYSGRFKQKISSYTFMFV